MYTRYFGFKERPFQLVPNPAFLFLSKSHEEAIAHLNFAIAQGEGFVEITGEVGTGKTTLCRAFLENLDENTEVACVFNPKLDSLDLLKTINDEFGIRSDARNARDLIDVLNRFLMEQKAQSRRVILLIDEAQNLSCDVLEQLRLLSNLETTTSKLLQIILVGQPELNDLLHSYNLRQLGQRITLSCRIRPLNYRETREYIRHRIHVASCQSGPEFTSAALRVIYRYSKGIPRLINMACDRALLTAYVTDRNDITGRTAATAVRELSGRSGDSFFHVLADHKLKLIIVIAICFFAAGSLFLPWRQDLFSAVRLRTTSTDLQPQIPDVLHPLDQDLDQKVTQIFSEELAGLETESRPALHFENILADRRRVFNRDSALEQAVTCWHEEIRPHPQLNAVEDNELFFRLSARQNGLSILRIEGDLDLVLRLNLPVIIEFYRPGKDSTAYLAPVEIMGDRMVFNVNDKAHSAITAGVAEIDMLWTGVAYVVWKNFLGDPGIIPLNSSSESIIGLKIMLREIGFQDIIIDSEYDEETRYAVKTIQQKHGITVDGVVGPLTRIALFNENPSLTIPHLFKDEPQAIHKSE